MRVLFASLLLVLVGLEAIARTSIEASEGFQTVTLATEFKGFATNAINVSLVILWGDGRTSNPLFPGIEEAVYSHILCISDNKFNSENLEVLVQNGYGQINNQSYKHSERYVKVFTDVPLKAISARTILSSIRIPPAPCEWTKYEIRSRVGLEFSIENRVFRDTFVCEETTQVREYKYSDECQN